MINIFEYLLHSERGPHSMNHDCGCAECRDDVLVLAVADGIGASDDSARASREAINRFISKDPWQNGLLDTVCELSDEFNVDGHTTFAAAKVKDGFLTVAYIGDSRVYLSRSGNPVLLTRDHNVRSKIEDVLGCSYRWLSYRRLNRFLDDPADPVFADDLCVKVEELISELPEEEQHSYVRRTSDCYVPLRVKRRFWKKFKDEFGLCLVRSLGKDSSRRSVGTFDEKALSAPCLYDASPKGMRLMTSDILIVATDGAYPYMDEPYCIFDVSEYARAVTKYGSRFDDSTIAIATFTDDSAA